MLIAAALSVTLVINTNTYKREGISQEELVRECSALFTPLISEWVRKLNPEAGWKKTQQENDLLKAQLKQLSDQGFLSGSCIWLER